MPNQEIAGKICHATDTVVCAAPHAQLTLVGGLLFILAIAVFVGITVAIAMQVKVEVAA